MTEDNTSGKDRDEVYRCGDCGHTEAVDAGEKAGDDVERTFGSGRREETSTILTCPECGSDDWLTQAVRELGAAVDEGVAHVC